MTCNIFLACLIAVCCIAYGSSTKEDNWCFPEIPCDDRQCTRRNNWCDGFTDCYDDESDEKYCKVESPNNCDQRLHFECSNKKCVPKVLTCDGFDDCGDMSDENGCMTTESFKYEYPDPTTLMTTSLTYSVPTPSSVYNMKIPLQPSVEHYDTRLPEKDNRRRSTIYNRGNVPYPGHTSGSDTSPTYYYPHYRQSRPRVPDQNQGSQIFATNPRYTNGAAPDSFYLRQLWPEIHQPRVVIHSQEKFKSVTQNKRRHRTLPLPSFHFEKNRVREFSYEYSDQIRRAKEWLLRERDNSNGWGADTPRALVALSLITNSFPSDLPGYDIMRRRLKVDLGAKLLRITEKPLSDNRLALYINALLGTCQDPRQIFNRDLVGMLYNRTHDARLRTQPSPFVLLTLCLSNGSFSREDLYILQNIVHSPVTDDVTKGRFILATSALACVHKTEIFGDDLREILSTASRKLLDQQLDDGSFGSVYSTALATQALFALDSNEWRYEKEALDFLSRHQLDDGSFGDMLATYYVLPVISGRSLVHLRNTQCERPDNETSSEDHDWNPHEPKKSILYSLAKGYQQRNSIALHMSVPAEANFFQIMQMAQKLDARFRFQYAEAFGKIDVHTISNIPNDPERGTYWNLYVLDRRNQTVDTSQIYYGDIRNLIPEDFQELLYWYLP